MKKAWNILKWTIAGIAGIVILAGVILILFAGPIGKYIIEHNSEKFTGRIILIDRMKINVFKGSANVYGLKMYEPDKKILFIGIPHMFIDLDKWKLVRGIYRIQHLLIESPTLRLVETGSDFNYDDIFKKLEAPSGKPPNPADTVPTKYFVEDFRITGGKVNYNNTDYQLHAQLLNTGVVIPSYSWNNPWVDIRYHFILRTGGLFKGDLNLNLSTLQYTHAIYADGFNLDVLYPYLTPYLKIKSIGGQLNLNVLTKGNFNDAQAIAVKGKSGMYKLSITDEEGRKVAGFRMFTQIIDSLNLKQNIWNFGPILLDGPYFRYELFPETDNFSRMLKSGTANAGGKPDNISATGTSRSVNPLVMIANYVSELAKEIVITDYRVKRFTITDGMTDYFDHTLDEEFHLGLSDMYLDVEQLNSAMNRCKVDFSTTINKGGFMKADISVNPKDFMDFDLKYEFNNVAVIDYNPYSIFHVAYPFTHGKFNYTGTVEVKNHQIKMDNKIFVEKIYAGKKVNNTTAMHLPLKLVLAILRDKHGNITLAVPVEGDLDNPKFNWWKVALQVLKSLFDKAIAAPAALLASATGASEEDLKEIKFDYAQERLTEKQMSHLKKLADILTDKPELVMEMKQTVDPEKDIEYLAYNEGKKRFYSETKNKQFTGDTIPKEDMAAISAMSVTDTAFITWLNQKVNVNDPMVSTLEKCKRLVGKEYLEEMHKARMEKRNKGLTNFLTTRLNLSPQKFIVSNNDEKAELPEDQIPRYMISYSVPE